MKNKKVDDYLVKVKSWKLELAQLRTIALECGLIEEWKWNQPCYTHEGKNIVIIGGFKSFCAFMFFKGALLHDPHKILVKAGENSQAGRQIRFESVQQITDQRKILKPYIQNAIEVEISGAKIPSISDKPIEILKELQEQFIKLPALEKSFLSLTKGRQRGYLIFFNGAKQSKTRTARIEKYIDRILAGYGFNDCTCGLSKRMPNCDGSHNSMMSSI